jgi:hypothetical protein
VAVRRNDGAWLEALAIEWLVTVPKNSRTAALILPSTAVEAAACSVGERLRGASSGETRRRSERRRSDDRHSHRECE